MTIIMKRTKKESAVSPVVGVMLMLVVTIIIAAVVATFAGGLAKTTDVAPVAVLDAYFKTTDASMGYSNIYVTDFAIDHLSGDEIPVKDIAITFTYKDTAEDKMKTYSFKPGQETGINFESTEGISYYSYGKYAMYLNGNPSLSAGEAVLKNGTHLQTAGNYIYDYAATPENTIMEGNPFVDVALTGDISSTYSNGVWSGGVLSKLGDTVHVTISHIPSNKVIFDKEVNVQ